MTSAQAMLLIQTLDPRACLRFSDFTRRWYVDASIDVSNGVTLTGVSEHRDTPELAIAAYLTALRSISLDQVIVARPAGERREFRWNGAAFVEQHGSIREWAT